MKSGGPWNLRGLRPGAREAARDAARQSGVSVGEWLNSVIQPSDTQDPGPQPAADFGDKAQGEPPQYPSQDDRQQSGQASRHYHRQDANEPEPYRPRDANLKRRDRIDIETVAARREVGSNREKRRREERDRREREQDQAREAARAREEISNAAQDLDERRAAARLEEQREAASREAANREAARREELQQEARLEEQREAARREGLRQEARLEEQREAARREELREEARQKELREAARSREEVGDMHARLDNLSRQIEGLARAAAAPRPLPTWQHPSQQMPSEPSEDAMPRLTGAPMQRRRAVPASRRGLSPSIQPPPADSAAAESRERSIEDAVAEITARQLALAAEAASDAPVRAPDLAPVDYSLPDDPRPAPHLSTMFKGRSATPQTAGAAAAPPAAPPAPAVDLSGLEKQLREITSQIEALRPANNIEMAITAVRTDLAEIGRQLTEALPRRAVESLEIEVRALGERIDHSRQCGVDSTALAGIEHGLAEVRSALRGLTPAENLVGFDEAVKTLAQKVDAIVGKEDPAALQQLETAIGGLRGVVSHVASNDTLAKVAEDVRSLAAKIDGLATSAASGHALSALESRIDTLATALNASTEAGYAVPRELEKLLTGLIDKLEWVQLTHTDHAALAHLEDRIAMLVKRLDTSDARLGPLEAVERGVADLLVHMEKTRSAGNNGDSVATLAPAVADAIERDVAEIKQSERHVQDSLEAVQGTVEHVIDRLAKIEGDLHRDATARAVPEQQWPMQAPELAPAQPEGESETMRAGPNTVSAPAAIEPIAQRAPAGRLPIDPNLPPNYPLEPGSAAGRARPGASAADRIAASEAAISSAKPPVIPDPPGKPDFIAAARRAAQAAAATPHDRRPGLEAAGQDGDAAPKVLSQRLRKLIVAGGAVLIVVGCLHIASRLFEDSGTANPPAPKVEKTSPPTPALPKADPSNLPAPAPTPLPAPPSGAATDAPPSTPPATAKPENPGRQSMLPDGAEQPAAATPPSNDKPTASAIPSWSPDITGSVPQPAAAPGKPPAPAAAAIGGTALRDAAMAGNPAAAYELAMRFAEGHGVIQSNEEAAHWLERAAKHGLAPAQFRLGGLYEKGLGVKKDLAAARDLYRAAADKGNGKAMHNLAVLFAEGINGPPDYHSAAHWFRMAADHGVTDSQYNLGILYARGIGVEQNSSEAYKWFVLAANQGDRDAAKKRDDLAAHLDAQALTAARLAAQTWTAKPQPDEAINVRAPAAGWDAPAKSAQAARPKPRLLPGAKTAAPDSKVD